MPTLAFDKASLRRDDVNGYLHVDMSHLTKAQVVEYYGREIPGYAEIGLGADLTYKVYRPADELRKAVQTFNNLPILNEHTPVSSYDWDNVKEKAIGSTGTDARIIDEGEETYLDNSLTFYSAEFIDKIKDGTQREISAGYRYTPVLEAGAYNGQPYQVKMTNIIGNHVVTCEEGRAGSDVMVADSKPTKPRHEMTEKMKKALQALNGLAMDSKSPSVRQKAGKLVAMALDAEGDEIEKKEDELIQGLANVQAEEKDMQEKGPVAGDQPMSAEEILAKIGELLKGASAQAQDADEDKKDDKGDDKKDDDKGMAQDAVQKLVATETEKARKEERARFDATQEVRPLVGDLNAFAFDSAADVYKHTLEAIGVSLDGIEPAAYKGMVRVKLSEKPGVIAQDAKIKDSITEAFPGLKNIRR